ncbi:dolichyl-diphosphooligosaccharide--protein glycosyltransferase subunit 1 [Microbotryomycetes sp. JL221]|nr:dolichyl-diphosphooligosaccharide--protein glycosyltransferase subunit 1 [Microbotryomycetes sp. JL221]
MVTRQKVALAASTLLLSACAAQARWSPRVVTSTVELSGILTRTATSYVLEHDSSDASLQWQFGVKQDQALIEVQLGRGGNKQTVTPRQAAAAGDDSGATIWTVDLPQPAQGTATTVTIATTSSRETKPDPPALPQNADSILMLWSGDLMAPLSIMSDQERQQLEEVKIKVKAPSPRIGDIKAPDAFNVAHTKGGATVTFTLKSSDAQSSSTEPQTASIQYVQPEAIASMRTLNRIVEISHWGSVMAVQDNIDLFNSGPELLGQFSRLDFQRASMQRRASNLAVTSIQVVLPPNIERPYYYDTVGNVSTSRFRPSSAPHQAVLPSQRRAKANAASTLDLFPRFPLMGGWNYTFTMGYDAPLKDFEKKRISGAGGSQHILGVPFLTPIKNVAVDAVRFEVRLPEGASNIKVHTPFPVDAIEQGGLTKTYLDTTGRPTVVLRKRNCSDQHGGLVLIEYTLSPLLEVVRKPLAIAVMSFAAFLIIFVSKRIDWSIPGADPNLKRDIKTL